MSIVTNSSAACNQWKHGGGTHRTLRVPIEFGRIHGNEGEEECAQPQRSCSAHANQRLSNRDVSNRIREYLDHGSQHLICCDDLMATRSSKRLAPDDAVPKPIEVGDAVFDYYRSGPQKVKGRVIAARTDKKGQVWKEIEYVRDVHGSEREWLLEKYVERRGEATNKPQQESPPECRQKAKKAKKAKTMTPKKKPKPTEPADSPSQPEPHAEEKEKEPTPKLPASATPTTKDSEKTSISPEFVRIDLENDHLFVVSKVDAWAVPLKTSPGSSFSSRGMGAAQMQIPALRWKVEAEDAFAERCPFLDIVKAGYKLQWESNCGGTQYLFFGRPEKGEFRRVFVENGKVFPVADLWVKTQGEQCTVTLPLPHYTCRIISYYHIASYHNTVQLQFTFANTWYAEESEDRDTEADGALTGFIRKDLSPQGNFSFHIVKWPNDADAMHVDWRPIHVSMRPDVVSLLGRVNAIDHIADIQAQFDSATEEAATLTRQSKGENVAACAAKAERRNVKTENKKLTDEVASLQIKLDAKEKTHQKELNDLNAKHTKAMTKATETTSKIKTQLTTLQEESKGLKRERADWLKKEKKLTDDLAKLEVKKSQIETEKENWRVRYESAAAAQISMAPHHGTPSQMAPPPQFHPYQSAPSPTVPMGNQPVKGIFFQGEFYPAAR